MSEQDRKVGITVVANNGASATFQEIKADAAAMAATVNAAGQQAAQGIKEIGDGAEVSEAKVARAQGRITSELIRVTEQARIAAEAGGSLSKALEIKADMRGVSAAGIAPAMSVLTQYESALSVARAKEAELAAQNAFAAKAAQAQQLSKASEYARWWTAELEKAELAEQKLAAQNSFIGSLKSQSDAIGKTREDLLEMKAAQLGLTTQAAPFISKLREADAQVGKMGISAAQTAAAMRMVPAQFTDIIVSLQGGQAPLTVLLQQGGQLKDMFGGVGAAGQALGSYMLGLVSPLTMVAAAVALLGFSYYKGSQEADNYRKALLMSGNQAGVTVDQLGQMARSMAAISGTQSAAAAGLAEMAQHSKIGSDKLQEFTSSALLWQRTTGQAVADVAKNFADLSKDPVKAVLALNDQMNFLTATVYNQIKALEDQGRAEEAAALAQQAYSDAMATRSTEMLGNMGSLERGWNTLANAAKKAWDAMLNVGRPASLEEIRSKIDATNRDLNNMLAGDGFSSNGGGAAFGAGGRGRLARIERLKAQLGDLQAQAAPLEAADYSAEVGKIQGDYVSAKAKFDQISTQYASKETKRTNELKVAETQYLDTVKKTNAALAGSADLERELASLSAGYARQVDGINKKYTEKGKSGSSKPARDALSIDINATKRDLEVLTFSYSSAQKIMEAQRAAGLVDDKAYYEEKRKYINLEADAQDKLLQAEMDRYKQEKVTKDNRLQVEKGIADTQAKMDKAKMERSTALQVLSYQETGALNAQKLAMDSLATSHQRALDLMREQAAREVNSAWMGTKERQRSESLQSIKDSYANEQRQLEDRLLFTPNLSTEQKAQINQRLSYLKEEKAERLRIAQETYTELDSLQSRWELGAGFAMQNYVDQAANVAQQTADLFTNSFKGMEDSLVTFVTTGKLSFTSLASSAVADITRIIIKQQISNALGVGGAGGGSGGLMGLIGTGLGMLTGSATGAQTGAGTMSALQDLGVFAKGDVFANSASLSAYSNQVHDTPKFFAFAQGAGVFGEAGPEAIMPLTRAPDGNLGVRALAGGGQGGSTNINVTVQMPQGGSRETALQFGRTVGRQIAVAQSRNG